MTAPTFACRHREPAGVDLRPVVLLADTHAPSVSVVRSLFAYLPELRLRVAGDVDTAFELARRDTPALLMLGLGLPGGGAEVLLTRLCSDAPSATWAAVALTPASPLPVPPEGFVEIWPRPLRIGPMLRGIRRWTGGDGLPEVAFFAAAPAAFRTPTGRRLCAAPVAVRSSAGRA